VKDESFASNLNSAIDFLGNEWHFDCIGCAIAKGGVTPPGGIIYSGEAAFISADPEIPIPGFLIVNTKQHIRSLSELDSAGRHEVADIMACAEKALKSLGIDEITLVQEERSSHFHVWIFPNYDWMTEEFGKGITYLRGITVHAKEKATEENKQEVLQIVEKVRDYFNSHNIED